MRQPPHAQFGPLPDPGDRTVTAAGVPVVAVVFAAALAAASHPTTAAALVLGALTVPAARRIWRAGTAFCARYAGARRRARARSEPGARAE